MKKHFFILHPISIFVTSLLALGLALFFYLNWYFRLTTNVSNFVQRFNVNPEVILSPHSWVIILITSLLFGAILVGLAIIFIYNQKAIYLYSMQENFINNFTHELKTPIASIRLYLETFKKYDLPREKQLEFINFMLKDATRLSSHVQQILLVGGLESRFGRESWETLESLNILHVIEEFLRNNGHLFKHGEVTLENLATVTPVSLINRSLFDILLMNLINNAFKHNHNKFIKVKILLYNRKNILYINFEDNGIGIKKEEQEHVFKKFYLTGKKKNSTNFPAKEVGPTKGSSNNSSSDNSSNEKLEFESKGTGLGLYISKQIMKIHHGKIMVSSSGMGQGSIFTVSLPLRLSLRGQKSRPLNT